MTPLPIVCLNGQCLPAESARISPLGDGVLFGRGVFETIRVLDGRVAFLKAHLARAREAAAALNLQWTSTHQEIGERVHQVIAGNKLIEGSVKLAVFADVSGAAAELILARDFSYPPHTYETGFRLVSVPGKSSTSLVCGAPGRKSTSYLANLIAREDAKRIGADDALFVAASGNVLEASASNIFAVLDGAVFTPPLSEGILPGIARAELIRRASLPIREKSLRLEEIKAASEVFVTNALLGVMPVSKLDETTFQVGGDSAARTLMSEFVQWQREDA